ncbi:RidA family protein [Moellerella wisconsensis]|uniref:Endoribonuclease n=1 Tax=Moellerella wisconsensis ATCC 35017 TaxID=1354267 RepID=A0A0N0Z7E5_9GAMM|nr:Rid family detoxifying hydrolase [Moellerella wisconsensis]KPD01778.1 endoribonuclease [Moellerella wisconsensis ATCC 35017]VFS54517.1 Enamine/imine deaminase [Moellerella wisconsensis]
MKYIQTDNALKPAGHYSQAIKHAGLLYVSGQLPIDPDTGNKVNGDIKEQANCVFDNLKLILKQADTDINQVIKLVIYISSVELWDQVNDICGDFFISHKPVRTIVPTRDLHFGFNIEVDCIAICE